MIIPITPVPAYPNEATQLLVDDGHVTLDLTANFQYTLLDANGNPVSQPSRNSLTTIQYNNWGADDTYVAKCIAQNIGLTPV